MPPPTEPDPETLERVIRELGIYPREAFEFIDQGVQYTATKLHGPTGKSKERRHVSGQQLCEGLRELALLKWGMLARTVLERWNIQTTRDFGRIVFTLVDSGLMSKTEEDSIADFEKVYDFRTAFETGYQIKGS